MEESTKDTMEYASVQAIAGLLELLPGGSLMSRALLVPVEIAERNRTERTLNALAADIEKLQGVNRLPSMSELAASDSFMANLTEVVRATKATSDEEKRRFLRNALLNAELDSHPTELNEFFIRLVSRYGSLHVRMLEFIEALPAFGAAASNVAIAHERAEPVADLAVVIDRAFPDSRLLNAAVFEDLRRDALIVATDSDTNAPVNTRDPTGPDSLSELGYEFVRFLRDPLEVDGEETPGS